MNQDGRGVGGHALHLSPWMHQEYSYRYKISHRTPPEYYKECLTTGKDCKDPCVTEENKINN